jgi:SAM-dependent methyltransferase
LASKTKAKKRPNDVAISCEAKLGRRTAAQVYLRPISRSAFEEAATMSKPNYDQSFWENLWSTTIREHADTVARRPPNAHLVHEAASLDPGRALDAGCGHGAESLWLAARGWQVTAVDFSANALAQGRSMAEAMGADLSERVTWVEGDLAKWTIPAEHFDLVVCLYVHVAGPVQEMVHRMANGVALGGTLLMVGHRPIDPTTGAATTAAGQVQVSVEGAVAALDPRRWELLVAEERLRPVTGSGVDAVIRARRLS